ncbi:Predicted acetyltransferase [Raineyella antarctica]|uniref:Predicted acetyltransferase n=1 Tax=Raineyella antarctica TaxID=1577474 RepID=A0A1G6GPI6_9ACTN|nr:GNAT family N-acetyltransferase [Raineyella antarctica]SDB83675.1 Predicted acetyltransferase [Raineyella antarctica]
MAPVLVEPDIRFHASFLELVEEWGEGLMHGFSLEPEDDVSTPDGFATWVRTLLAEETVPRKPSFVTSTTRWIVEDDAVLGSVQLRHELNEFLAAVGGHVGYGVRPSARRRGLARFAMAGILDIARERGLGRVMVSCDVDNIGSRRTIEGAGGVFQDVVPGLAGRPYRRYWIDLD